MLKTSWKFELKMENSSKLTSQKTLKISNFLFQKGQLEGWYFGANFQLKNSKISMIDRQIFQSIFIEIKIAYAKSFVPFLRPVYFAQHQQNQHIGLSAYYLE